MLSNMPRLAIGALAAWLCCSGLAMAQNPILDQFYGAGLHQYFNGNYPQAVTELNEAVNAGTKDPRVYYFRALASIKLGKQSAADSDLKKGAELESADINQFYPVSRSLERVQGAPRLYLEKFRIKARAEAYVRQEQRNKIRYEQQRRAEDEVLLHPPAPPVPSLVTPVEPKAPAEPPAPEDPGNPFETPDAAPPAEEPTDSAPEADSSPSADEESPFEESAEMIDDSAPAEEKPAAETDAPAEDSEEENLFEQ